MLAFHHVYVKSPGIVNICQLLARSPPTGGCQKKEPPSKMAYLVYNDYK